MGSALRTTASLAQFTIGRAVHVKIHPRPRNLNESRDVLRALERFGEVTIFKHLKYEPSAPAPNSAIAIYQQPESAKRATDANMVYFNFGQVDSAKESGASYSGIEPESETCSFGSLGAREFDMQGDSEEDASDTRLMPNPQQSENSNQDWNPVEEDVEEFGVPPNSQQSTISFKGLQMERPCTLVIRPSALSHSAYIARQGYYGPFPLEESTAPGVMLLGKVPRGLKGLYNFDVQKEEEQINVRRKRIVKQNEEINARGWTTLQDLWEKGKRDRGQA